MNDKLNEILSELVMNEIYKHLNIFDAKHDKGFSKKKFSRKNYSPMLKKQL